MLRLLFVVIILSWSIAATAAVRVEALASLRGTAIQVNDTLISWERLRNGVLEAQGRFDTPFDVRDFEIGQLARGGTRIQLDRNGVRLTISPAPGPWGVETGLLLDGPQQVTYDRGLDRARARDIPGALAAWRPLALDLDRGPQVRASVWLAVPNRRACLSIRWPPVETSTLKNGSTVRESMTPMPCLRRRRDLPCGLEMFVSRPWPTKPPVRRGRWTPRGRPTSLLASRWAECGSNLRGRSISVVRSFPAPCSWRRPHSRSR